ncbi:MAG TPA: excinuclease ABC subunit UvrC [Solirubrobacteraceae bacterium]|jgi:excinuclease ABC subunit C|nr:excinuclease ABC subunit UvrC [Solirubrobacteraceae bacterium]
MASAPTSEGRRTRLAEQRRALPDGPGVYLFRDAERRVIYVGKAKSIRKRVASHFSSPVTRGAYEMVDAIDSVEFVLVASEAEALLAEQNFIKQYRPRFNIRLRDDKSYPFIAISTDEDYPRVYFTRERHRRNRVYFGPYSNAKRVRGTLDLLGKVFLFRTCQGAEPGRRSGSPCLDYYIHRCGAPCVGYVTPEEYRESIDGVVAFLSGRYREIERDLERRMAAAAEAQDYERAALERNRLRAVRSLLERQRVANEAVGTLDAIAVAVDGTDANAQVFQVRDGVLSDRQSFYLENAVERDVGEVAEEFVLQYYGDQMAIPAQVIVQSELELEEREALAGALGQRRGAAVEVRAAERGDKRRILELAERNALLALDQERLKAERRRQQRVEALDGLQEALGLDALPLRIECFDISNLMGTHTTASMVVFEGGAPKKSDYRRFNVRGLSEGVPDDVAAMEEVLARRLAQWETQQDLSPHDPKRNESFATLPNLVVIDGGPGQLSAGLRALEGFRRRGVAVVSLAKRIEEVFTPGVRAPVVLPHDTPALQLLQRVRDEAHRFAITHHRTRRDRAMTTSILDDLPGIGPARKRVLLNHFGSPEAVLAATREQLEAVPGLPGKTAREIWTHLHRTGD